jgi:hypothetical protein
VLLLLTVTALAIVGSPVTPTFSEESVQRRGDAHVASAGRSGSVSGSGSGSGGGGGGGGGASLSQQVFISSFDMMLRGEV